MNGTFQPRTIETGLLWNEQDARFAQVDLCVDPGLRDAFHKIRREVKVSTKELLIQMIRHCVPQKAV